MILGCCALDGISGFPYDEYDDWHPSEWEKSRWARIELQAKSARCCLATVNRDQLKAKKLLERHGFKVVGQLTSEDDGRTIYLMAKGVRQVLAPRTKRGQHAKRK
jgi:hypothetical protein